MNIARVNILSTLGIRSYPRNPECMLCSRTGNNILWLMAGFLSGQAHATGRGHDVLFLLRTAMEPMVVCIHTILIPSGELIIHSSLPCGHVHCETCLETMFRQTLVLHMQKHPSYDARHLEELRDVLRRSTKPEDAVVRRNVCAEIGILEGLEPHPRFTCPKCRAVVTSRPIEAYPLKEVVSFVSEIRGEARPDIPASAERDILSDFFPCYDPFT